jgi:hypothetical protein
MPFPLYWLACCAAVALALAALQRAATPEGRQEIASAWWVVTLTLTLYLLSYYGSYGEAGSVIRFPYDSAAAAILALATYGWAVRSGYRTPDLQALQSRGVVGFSRTAAQLAPPHSAPLRAVVNVDE